MTQDSGNEALFRILRGELEAVETYRQAADQLEDPPARTIIDNIRDDHDFAAHALRNVLAQHSVQGTIGELHPIENAVFKVGKLVSKAGARATLSALRAGEQFGIVAYERALIDATITPEAANLIEHELLPRCREHVVKLDQMAA
jgi:rubrerythrin